jgi:methanogenic corrinoid protein MtbC1
MEHGMKISHISKLSDKEIYQEIDKLILDTESNDLNIEAIINQLLISISAFDEPQFDKAFANAILRLGIVNTYTRVIYPLLMRAGLMWTKEDIMPAQEHFLSNLLKQKIFAAIDALPIPQNPVQTWVLFLDEQEEHEIGLLFASYLLRSQGKKVIYLGQKVPFNNLLKAVSACQATHVYTFFVRNTRVKDLVTMLSSMLKDFPALKVCFSGRSDILANITPDARLVNIQDIESLLKLTC